jgi:hypothetical protein
MARRAGRTRRKSLLVKEIRQATPQNEAHP